MDLKEVTMAYDDKTAETQITRRSALQKRVWGLFDLGSVEEQLIRYRQMS